MHSADDLAPRFKRLYYHLYSNASSSRAEAILSELAGVLLIKLAAEKGQTLGILDRFMVGDLDGEALVASLRASGQLSADVPDRLSEDNLRKCLGELDGVSLSSAPAHIVGEAFQAVMGPRLRGERGQFFTPTSLSAAMVEILDPGPTESVVDPACGTGGFLLECHAHQVLRGQPVGRLFGADKDSELARLAEAIVSVVAGVRGTVRCQDSLVRDSWQGNIPEGGFDVVVTNPPFGAKIPIRSTEILAGYDLALPWRKADGRWTPTGEPHRPQDPQVLFVELCLNLLRPGGRMGIVLPEGIFGNSRAGFLWAWLRERARITALIDCPRTAFQPGTDTKTNIVFLEKRPTVGIDHVWIAKAETCGQDRRGKNTKIDGTPHPDDFPKIGAEYKTRGEPSTSAWVQRTLHNPDYVVPRYYLGSVQATALERELTEGAQAASLGELVGAGSLQITKGHEVGAEAYGTGDIPFVRTSDLANFEVRGDPSKSVSEAVYARFGAEQGLRPGDVLLAVDGRYRIGATAMVTADNRVCVVQSHLRILRCQGGGLDPYGLLFALNLPSVRARMKDLVFVQSTLGTLGGRVLELTIPVLTGDGPWRARVDAFRQALQTRDTCLAELGKLIG